VEESVQKLASVLYNLQVCGRSLAGIAGSIPVGSTEVCFF